jgi:release factor glutamine methyltransferase
MTADVYRAGEDTLLLAETLERLGPFRGLAGEIGCGSGLVTEVLASLAEEVVASDVMIEAVRATWLRVKREKLDWRVHAVCCDRFEALREGEVFGLVASNPPYLPVEGEDVTYSGGPTGVEVPLSFAESAARRLSERGFIVFLLSSLSDWRRALEALAGAGFRVSVLCSKGVGLFEELLVILASRSAPSPARARDPDPDSETVEVPVSH